METAAFTGLAKLKILPFLLPQGRQRLIVVTAAFTEWHFHCETCVSQSGQLCPFKSSISIAKLVSVEVVSFIHVRVACVSQSCKHCTCKSGISIAKLVSGAFEKKEGIHLNGIQAKAAFTLILEYHDQGNFSEPPP